MMFSHHPPCQYNRTFSIGKFRFCTRCTGLIIGIIISLLFFPEIRMNTILLFLSLLLPMPAVINFTLCEIGRIANNNYCRIFTGVLLGISIGLMIQNLLNGNLIEGISIFLWIVVLEIITILILNKAKVLENFFSQYEQGIYKN